MPVARIPGVRRMEMSCVERTARQLRRAEVRESIVLTGDSHTSRAGQVAYERYTSPWSGSHRDTYLMRDEDGNFYTKVRYR